MVREFSHTNQTYQEKLGGGHFSDVYKGLLQGTTPCVLKKLKRKDDFDDFLNEELILRLHQLHHFANYNRECKHPHIVQVGVLNYYIIS